MIKLNKDSWFAEIIMVSVLLLNIILFNFFNLFEKLSLFKIGICNSNCVSLMKAIDNPFPWICFFGVYILILVIIFSKIIDHPKYKFFK